MDIFAAAFTSEQDQLRQKIMSPKKLDALALASSFVRHRCQNVCVGMSRMATTTGNSTTSLVSDLDRVLDILDSAEDIVWDTTAEHQPQAQADADADVDVDFEPTPLGPQGVQVLVQELPPLTVSLSMEEVQEDLLHVLNHLLTQSPAAKRRRLSKEQELRTTSIVSSTSAAVLSSAPLETTSTTSTNTSTTSLADTSDEERFRPYQSDQWQDRFLDLVEFQQKNGHCLVPHNFPENQQLSQWIKRQRYQYKLKQSNRHSTLTDERQTALENMGFVWDSHKAAWIERFESLKQFRAQQGHCSVPSNYLDRSLAIWVKCQRRQYKLFHQGVKSTMTQERFSQLDLFGFEWNPRNL